MIKLVLLWFLFLLSGFAGGAAAADPVASFKTLIASASSVRTWDEVTFNDKTNGWIKSYYVVSNIEYDVRKTDSLVNPTIGIATFTVIQKTSPKYDSQQGAQQSDDLQPHAFVRDFDVKYHISKGKWTTSDARYKSKLVGGPAAGSFGSMEYKPSLKGQLRGFDKVLAKWFPGYHH